MYNLWQNGGLCFRSGYESGVKHNQRSHKYVKLIPHSDFDYFNMLAFGKGTKGRGLESQYLREYLTLGFYNPQKLVSKQEKLLKILKGLLY